MGEDKAGARLRRPHQNGGNGAALARVDDDLFHAGQPGCAPPQCVSPWRARPIPNRELKAMTSESLPAVVGLTFRRAP
jgi:hypothetical protein